MEDLKKQQQELRESLLKKSLIITEKDLVYKNFRFNAMIAVIILVTLALCYFALWVNSCNLF